MDQAGPTDPHMLASMLTAAAFAAAFLAGERLSPVATSHQHNQDVLLNCVENGEEELQTFRT